MKDLAGRIAVITGGGTGMGRELARQLVAEGCSIAMCDVSAAAMAETKRLCEVERLPQGLRITTHIADVANEDDVKRFAAEVAKQHDTDKIHLLFNNAGIGGGGSMIVHERSEWERTFNICWFGVYYCTRAFLPMMLKADRGHIVNTSSVNGFWASIGPGRAAHRLQRRQVRREGVQRGAADRPQHERAAHQVLGGDARPYRHLDRHQLAQDPGRPRLARLHAQGAGADARPRGVDGPSTSPSSATRTSASSPTSARGASSRMRRRQPPRPPRSSSTA